jgi:hypothetical protein
MIDYNSITSRSQDTIDRIYQAAEKRDLAELAQADETEQSAPIMRQIDQAKHSILRKLLSVKLAGTFAKITR